MPPNFLYIILVSFSSCSSPFPITFSLHSLLHFLLLFHFFRQCLLLFCYLFLSCNSSFRFSSFFTFFLLSSSSVVFTSFFLPLLLYSSFLLSSSFTSFILYPLLSSIRPSFSPTPTSLLRFSPAPSSFSPPPTPLALFNLSLFLLFLLFLLLFHIFSEIF